MIYRTLQNLAFRHHWKYLLPFTSPLPFVTPATLVSWIILKHIKHVPTSRLCSCYSCCLQHPSNIFSQLLWVFIPNYDVSQFFPSSALWPRKEGQLSWISHLQGPCFHSSLSNGARNMQDYGEVPLEPTPLPTSRQHSEYPEFPAPMALSLLPRQCCQWHILSPEREAKKQLFIGCVNGTWTRGLKGLHVCIWEPLWYSILLEVERTSRRDTG